MTRFAVSALALIGVVTLLSIIFSFEEITSAHPAH